MRYEHALPSSERGNTCARARDAAQPVERPGKVLLPQRDAGVADLRFVPLAFALVELPDQSQHQFGGFRLLAQRLVEAPPSSDRKLLLPHQAASSHQHSLHKLASTLLAFAQLAAVLDWLRN